VKTVNQHGQQQQALVIAVTTLEAAAVAVGIPAVVLVVLVEAATAQMTDLLHLKLDQQTLAVAAAVRPVLLHLVMEPRAVQAS